MTTPELFQAWLDWLRLRGRSQATHDRYSRRLGRFLRFCEREKLVPALWQTRHLTEFASQLLEAGHSQRLVQNTLAVLATWLRWGFRKGHLLLDLTAELPPAPRPRLQRTATRQEVQRLLDQMERDTPMAVRDRTLLETLYGTGLRRGELVALNLDDLDLVAGVLHVRHGKGARQRRQPIGDHLAGVLSTYLETARPRLDRKGSSRALFLSQNDRRLSAEGLVLVVHNTAFRAGVRISCHGFRRAFATHLLEGGAPLRAVQELLGHRSIMATMAYAVITPDELRREHRRTHPRARRCA